MKIKKIKETEKVRLSTFTQTLHADRVVHFGHFAYMLIYISPAV